MKINTLPSAYVKPKKISLASNTLRNVTAILEVNGFVPLLLGNGDKPRVWLYIPANREGTEWYPLIKDNFSTNPNVTVKGGKKSITIDTPEGNIITARKEGGVINVTKLDLRPVGLDLYITGESVRFMGSTFTNNTFTNVEVMFGVGSKVGE
ncbi:TPA: hypothetical protein ACVO35_004177 [Vibrio alginolyticus]|uniref:hypothetical protein n=1 Tax=Vibrio alginolyticus TaxID=663 RepID=UPI0007A9F9A0|nr:hypothetical protein [Vibrio alginolyticus]KZC46049.1 hypothetical protein XM68_c12649 [Vibrio alginolyticus]